MSLDEKQFPHSARFTDAMATTYPSRVGVDRVDETDIPARQNPMSELSDSGHIQAAPFPGL